MNLVRDRIEIAKRLFRMAINRGMILSGMRQKWGQIFVKNSRNRVEVLIYFVRIGQDGGSAVIINGGRILSGMRQKWNGFRL